MKRLTRDQKIAKLWDAYEMADLSIQRREKVFDIRPSHLPKEGTAACREFKNKLKDLDELLFAERRLRSAALMALVNIGAFDDSTKQAQIRNLLKDAGVKLK